MLDESEAAVEQEMRERLRAYEEVIAAARDLKQKEPHPYSERVGRLYAALAKLDRENDNG